MKQSSNSCKHTPVIQPYNPRNRTPVDYPCVVPVYERFSPLADLLRLVICMLAGMALVALLVPVGFAADEHDSATPVPEYIPVVATATDPVLVTTAEPVLTTAVAEVYTQEAPTPAMSYCAATVNEGKTSNKTVWTGVGIIAVMICCNMWHNVILTKELSDKIDTMSRPQNRP